MNSWDKRYSDRVQLLVDILPVVAYAPYSKRIPLLTI